MRKTNLILLLLLVIILVIPPVSGTIVSLVPSSNNIYEDDVFTVTVQCSPSEPIKAWELSLTYNKNILYIANVTEGNIFPNNTFFMSGVIDNTKGSLTKTYGLILGPGMVQNPGSFIVITMYAHSLGLCPLNLQVGVTNEEDYIPVTTVNLSIMVRNIYDVNGDFFINMLDIVCVSNHYGERGSPGWIPEDVNNDGRVSVFDLMLLATFIW